MKKVSVSIFTALLVLLGCPVASAQQRTGSAPATAGGYPGTLVWSYKVVDGREVPDGKKSFSARSGEDTYTLEAEYKDGKLDGTASARLHKSYLATGREGGATQVWRASLDVTLTARFSAGRLNGMLTCNYTPSGSTRAGLQDMNKQSFSASYLDDGVRGNYSYINYGYAPRVGVSGSTDEGGFADGRWQEYEPQTASLADETYRHGARSTHPSSAVRNFLSGALSEEKLFEDFGYLAVEGERTFRAPADFLGYVLETWLKDYRKVIPYEFADPSLHRVKVVDYILPETFTAAGFERFKTQYYDALCGAGAMKGVTVALEGGSPGVAFAAEVFPEWKVYVRNAGADPFFVTLSPAQVAALQDVETVDRLRRERALPAADLLVGDSPYKDMMLAVKLPSDRIAAARGCEEIASVCSGAAQYAASVRGSVASLPMTSDKKFYIKDGRYYANPGWDFNLIAADAQRILASCKEASEVYEQGMEYAVRRPDLRRSYQRLCAPIVSGGYADMVGGIADARAFLEKVAAPDILGKVGSREEMQAALGSAAYAQLQSVYPDVPAADFSDVSGMEAFAASTVEYAAFQRNLLEYDALVRTIRAEKAGLDEALAVSRSYRKTSDAINERLSTYSLKPSFGSVAEYGKVKEQLQECLTVLKDAREYVTAHQAYTAESEALRETLSRGRLNQMSKFFKELSKENSLEWDNALPVGQCTAAVRHALAQTRRLSAAAAAPDASARDKAIKGMTDHAAIWGILEQ